MHFDVRCALSNRLNRLFLNLDADDALQVDGKHREHVLTKKSTPTLHDKNKRKRPDRV